MLRRNDNVVARKIHDTYFLIDIKQKYNDDKCFLYEINETGYYIWNAMSICSSVEQIADMLHEETGNAIDIKVLILDILEFLNNLKEEGYIVENGRN